jgi:hypothetical protein
VFDGGFLLNLGFYCFMGFTLYLGCWMGGSIGCCGYVVSYGFSCGLAESLLCILPV